MKNLPKNVEEFLAKKRIAILGVSRDKNQPANVIFRKLRDKGYKVFAVNPNAETVEGQKCYPAIDALPDKADAAVIATSPEITSEVVRECIGSGIAHIWMHRSFGAGSVSDEAIQECERNGIKAVVGGCPMMYVEPVDFGHKCMRWILNLQKKLPV